ncbi:Squalene monooxygenase [Gracilariopsis chorda]|uniref:Squalene monooxygenase n=1 Tax=Gracilariopsis chorda TaxID=448386 RepID=A0A2V3IZA9_9FLOR|nr:Squalene monooxygenase [Gracilariopsis chorda]|eukprot:PXF47478.1 Squalene monooxygenase [Gracilariopsis chorda]
MQSSSGYDVIVVGAGVAGGALINCLARDGRRLLCIERHLRNPDGSLTEPSRIVGELLQPGGCEKLQQLGLSEALTGIDAQPIYGYAMFLDGRSEKISYTPPQQNLRVGHSFHNGRFLKRLRQIAAHNANVTLVEGNVLSLENDAAGNVIGVSYRDAQKTLCRAYASLTIACDGCSSSLRKRAAAQHQVSVYSNFHGLVLDMSHIPFPNHGHVVLANPSPVLFYPISSTEVRCLVDISSEYQGDVSEYMLEVVMPQIPQQFKQPFEKAVTAGKSRMMPNRVMPAPAGILPGALLLGDSFNMRHPLTGGGMTVALSDVSIIRDLLRQVPHLSDVQTVTEKLRVFYSARKPMSTTINILANALYTLFCAKTDPALKDMRDACFEYLGQGGRMTHDPISMLGGIKPQRFLLVIHFFAVAFYGCGRALLPFPTPERLTKAWGIFRASFNVIKPLIDAENLRPLSWLPISSL